MVGLMGLLPPMADEGLRKAKSYFYMVPRILGYWDLSDPSSFLPSVSLSVFPSVTLSYEWLLDASSHLYNRVCPSVGRSVGPSVGRSVRGSRFCQKRENWCSHVIIQSFHHHEKLRTHRWPYGFSLRLINVFFYYFCERFILSPVT